MAAKLYYYYFPSTYLLHILSHTISTLSRLYIPDVVTSEPSTRFASDSKPRYKQRIRTNRVLPSARLPRNWRTGK